MMAAEIPSKLVLINNLGFERVFPWEFDVQPLIDLFETLPAPKNAPQICLTHSHGVKGNDRYFDGTGSLGDYETGKMLRGEQEFSEFIEEHKSHFVYNLYTSLSAVAAEWGFGIGRVRFMNMKPTSCLSYHEDIDEFRFHVPLITNPNALFIVGTRVIQMPQVGAIYALKTNIKHTAINGDRSRSRLHLVFSTYRTLTASG